MFLRCPLVTLFLQLTFNLNYLNSSSTHLVTAESSQDGHICGAMLSSSGNSFLLHLQALTIMKEDRLLVIINNWTASVPLDDVDNVDSVSRGSGVPLSGDSAQQLGRWNRLEWLRSTALAQLGGGSVLHALNLIDGEDGFIGVQYQQDETENENLVLHHQLISLADGQEVTGVSSELLGKYGIISDGRRKDVGASRSYVLRAGNSAESQPSPVVAWVANPVVDRASMQLNLPTTGHQQPPSPSFTAVTRSASESETEGKLVVHFSSLLSSAGPGPSLANKSRTSAVSSTAAAADGADQLPRVEELPGVFGIIVRGNLHLAINARQQVFIFKDPTYIFEVLEHQTAAEEGGQSTLPLAIVPFSRYFNCSAYDGPPLEDDDGSPREVQSKFSLFSRLGVIGLGLGLLLLLALSISTYRERSQALSGRRKSNVVPLRKGGKKETRARKNRASNVDSSSSSSNSYRKTAKGRGAHRGAFKKDKEQSPSTATFDSSATTTTPKSNSASKKQQQQSLKKTSWNWK